MTTTGQRLAELEPTHFWFAGRDELIGNLLARFGAIGPVLDIGCGSGSFARRLQRQGVGVVALDHELHRGEPPRVPGIAGDALRLPFRSGSAATVLLRDVLEHVDDGKSLDECARVLGRGGLLVAMVPAWPALWSCRDERAGHRRRYTRSTLLRPLRARGFDVLEVRGYQFALLPLLVTSRIAARRRGLAQLRTEDHPPGPVNALFARINRAEASLARIRWPRPPVGSTLVAVARRR